ncbi:MAG: hypothetical protein WA814_03755 [Candidatus Baltobacteraceae bacterium]
MIDCTLVTCRIVPALDPDDRLLYDELCKRGLDVAIAAWDDPETEWGATRLCVLRSTWDYHERYPDFVAWLRRAELVTAIRNDPRLLRWNAHKSYLRALQSSGVPIVPTAWIRAGSRCDLASLTQRRGWRDAVVKPALGAAAHDVTLVRRDGASSQAQGQAALDRLVATEDALVQPYLDSVTGYGERALIFIGGVYSHAVVKEPFDTVLSISDAPSSRIDATPEEIAVAAKAVAGVPGPPIYARVDLLRDQRNVPCVNEFELIEPALYLAVHAPARKAFADAIERELAAIAVKSRASLSL